MCGVCVHGGEGGECVCGVAWYYMYVLGRVACKLVTWLSLEPNIYTPHSHTYALIRTHTHASSLEDRFSRSCNTQVHNVTHVMMSVSFLFSIVRMLLVLSLCLQLIIIIAL